MCLGKYLLLICTTVIPATAATAAAATTEKAICLQYSLFTALYVLFSAKRFSRYN